jgi:tetratricopeptide (TPR) repeat protein
MRTPTAFRRASLGLIWLTGALAASGAFPSPPATVPEDDPDLVTLRAVADSFPPRLDGDAARARAVALFESLETRLLAAVAAAPADYELRTRLGDLYRMGHNLDIEGADDKAVQRLREAIGLAPEKAEARALLGIQYTGSGHPVEGERELRAALPLANADVLPAVQIALAFSCYQQGKFADSARYAGEYLKTHPDSPMAKGIFERSQSTLAGGAPPKTVEMGQVKSVPAKASPTPRPR